MSARKKEKDDAKLRTPVDQLSGDETMQHYNAIMLEDIRSTMRLILETVDSSIGQLRQELYGLRENLYKSRDDMYKLQAKHLKSEDESRIFREEYDRFREQMHAFQEKHEKFREEMYLSREKNNHRLDALENAAGITH